MNADRFARLGQVLDRRQPDLTVVMEGVHKPHNLSAILRSCDAAGVLDLHAVAASGQLTVSHGTSGGSSKWVRRFLHETSGEALEHLQARGFRLVAAHAGGGAVDFRDVDYTVPTAFVLGAELFGVSQGALARVDQTVVIPMVGMVESLNVSVATALLLFEAKRQRDAKGMYDSSRLDLAERDTILFEWAHPKIAARLRAHGQPYPALRADGEIADRASLRVLTGGSTPEQPEGPN